MGFCKKLKSEKYRPKIVLCTVYLAMMLDILLGACVYPILPDYLLKIKDTNSTAVLSTSHILIETEHSNSKSSVEYHETFASTNIPLSLLIGIKFGVQIITSFVVGDITYRIGYSIPLLIGFGIVVGSSMLFAFSTSFWMLLFARGLNGVGSGFIATAGMGLLAITFPDNEQRQKAISFTFGSIAIGIMAGPVLGGTLYSWGGIVLPFSCLAALGLLLAVVQLTFLQTKIDHVKPEHTNYVTLMSDPYIVIAIFSIWTSNLGFCMIEAALPLWMIEQWSSTPIDQGLVFLPSSIAYLAGANVLTFFSNKLGAWLCCLIGHIWIGGFVIALPFTQNIYQLFLPVAIIGLGLGLVDTNMFPLLAHIADLRHTKVYGSVYAIGEAASNFSFLLGPLIAGPVVKFYGFTTMMAVASALNLIMIPFMFIIKQLPKQLPEKDQKEVKDSPKNKKKKSFVAPVDSEATEMKGIKL